MDQNLQQTPVQLEPSVPDARPGNSRARRGKIFIICFIAGIVLLTLFFFLRFSNVNKQATLAKLTPTSTLIQNKQAKEIKTDKYTLFYPSDWQVTQVKSSNSYIELISPSEKDGVFYSRILVQNVSDNPQTQQELPALYKSLGISGEVSFVNGKEITKYSGVVQTATVNNKTIHYPHWETTDIFSKNKDIYILSYQYSGTIANIQNEEILSQIVRSFVINN